MFLWTPIIELIMLILLLLGQALILGFLALGIRNLVVAAQWEVRERAEFIGSEQIQTCDFFILVPALREQRVIKRTLTGLSALDYPKEKFQLVVALEKREESIGSPTKNAVQAFIQEKGGNNISIIEYDGAKQQRSNQLNAAFDAVGNVVRRRGLDPKHVVIGVFDADSLPHKMALNYIDYKLRTSDSVAFQQVPCYLLNFGCLKGRNLLRQTILRANAYYQTLWFFLSELPLYFSSKSANLRKAKSLIPPYCLGHGEFFRFDILERFGGFPTQAAADGIQVGFLLNDHLIPISPVPYDDLCESPENLRSLFRQHAHWAFGSLQFSKTVKIEKVWSRECMQNLINISLVIKWALGPYFVIGIITNGFLSPRLVLNISSAILVVTILVYYITGFRFIINRIASYGPKSKTLTFRGPELILAAIFKSFGALYCVSRMAIDWLLLRRTDLVYKVER